MVDSVEYQSSATLFLALALDRVRRGFRQDPSHTYLTPQNTLALQDRAATYKQVYSPSGILATHTTRGNWLLGEIGCSTGCSKAKVERQKTST